MFQITKVSSGQHKKLGENRDHTFELQDATCRQTPTEQYIVVTLRSNVAAYCITCHRNTYMHTSYYIHVEHRGAYSLH